MHERACFTAAVVLLCCCCTVRCKNPRARMNVLLSRFTYAHRLRHRIAASQCDKQIQRLVVISTQPMITAPTRSGSCTTAMRMSPLTVRNVMRFSPSFNTPCTVLLVVGGKVVNLP